MAGFDLLEIKPKRVPFVITERKDNCKHCRKGKRHAPHAYACTRCRVIA